MHPQHLVYTLLIFFCQNPFAQTDTSGSKIIDLPDKIFRALDRKSLQLEKRLDRQTEAYLSKLQRKENRLRKKLAKKDPALAERLFSLSDSEYRRLKDLNGKDAPGNPEYSGHLDSLTTGLNFLQQYQGKNVPVNPALAKTLSDYKVLQQKLQATTQVKAWLQQRQQLLKEQFQKLGMIRQLKAFRKQVYYYQAQVKEYRAILEDPARVETKILELVQTLPRYKEFFSRNSTLARLFALPGGGNSASPTQALAGLQTRAMVNQTFIDRFGQGQDLTRLLQQNLQNGQGQLDQLKQRVAAMQGGSYGNSNGEVAMPDFKVNSQKTKSFFKRLELGTNFQSQKAKYFFPAMEDIGLSLGYKINDKSIAGIGGSYKLGLGYGWDHIRLTNEGIGLRTFLDYKLKHSLFISGGYEQNYLSAFRSVAVLKKYDMWQKSGLVGITKKYQLPKKMKGSFQLLWDFLSYRQIPQAQPIVFRVGYGLH